MIQTSQLSLGRRVIKSFKGKAEEAVFNGTCPKGFPPDLLKTARRKLRMLDAATQLEDLRAPPGNNLKALSGALAGYHAIRINDQFRIIFRWRAHNAQDVAIVDYH